MERPNKKLRLFVTMTQSMLLDTMPEELGMEVIEEKVEASPHRERTRRMVNDIFNEQGPYYVRRAYRMNADSFWSLHRMLKAGIGCPDTPQEGSEKTHKNGAKNGLIPTSVRLSAAIRYFAGGRPDDIALVHGISHSEVFNSVWKVVAATISCESLDIEYPSDYEEQSRIAQSFSEKSEPEFSMCGGAIDGMLVWIEKPNDATCKEAQCGPMKFMCGRKKKFGVNLQGVCDVNGKFLDVSVGHPASTSDYLAFSTSTLYHRLEQEGFLKPGICLFGDLAYVNTGYMATPFKAVRSGTKDDYNFFHSQLRIHIECAFGMLVSCWGILRRALPASINLQRSMNLVMCLCRLHNFCIDERLRKSNRAVVHNSTSFKIAEHLAIDKVGIIANGGVPLRSRRDKDVPSYASKLPEQLLHGGHHHDDTERKDRRRVERAAKRAAEGGELPRDILHGIVVMKELQRPEPNQWKEEKSDYYTV